MIRKVRFDAHDPKDDLFRVLPHNKIRNQTASLIYELRSSKTAFDSDPHSCPPAVLSGRKLLLAMRRYSYPIGRPEGQ